MRCVHPVLLVALTAGPMPTPALEVDAIDVRVADHTYRVHFEGLVAAPLERVTQVLTDYAAYASLDPRIRASKVIGTSESGQALLRTSIRACAGIFCRTVMRTEKVTHLDGRLVAVVVPAASDLKGGITRTEWRGEPGGTRVWYDAEFEPGFWVPDIVARHYAASGMRDSVVQLFENVEERARER